MNSLVLCLLALPQGGPTLDARSAEHLWNRAGFGADSALVARTVEQGLAATLDGWFAAAGPGVGAFEPENLAYGGILAAEVRPPQGVGPRGAGESEGTSESMGEAADGMDEAAKAAAEEERRRELARSRVQDGLQLAEYTRLWVEGMVAGEDPLRDRMTLFWHGHFTSSMQTVRSSHALIRQHQFLRANALGNFRTLLLGILRDPAMLVYLDNHRNRRGNPNENLARELLELFTLGEGHYSEQDVKEAARALTGRAAFRGEYVFTPRRHDSGVKTVLGVSGPMGGDELVEAILSTDRAAEYLAERLLRWFEGIEPAPERIRAYAQLLRERDWELEPWLRALFQDPEFYRPEVLGARVAGPVDYLVGSTRRLKLEPPPMALVLGASNLGERLFHPPSVKGWDGGEAWITTSSLLARGNLAGMLVGSIGIAELLGAETEGESMESMEASEGRRQRSRTGRVQGEELRRLAGRDSTLRELGRLGRRSWAPQLDLAKQLAQRNLSEDREVVLALLEDLLAIAPPPETVEELVAYLAAEREQFSIPDGRLTRWNQDGEQLLQRLAHRILALPEAQLH